MRFERLEHNVLNGLSSACEKYNKGSGKNKDLEIKTAASQSFVGRASPSPTARVNIWG